MTCEHPSMQNMDHGGGPFGAKVRTANRMCLKCGQHWYGPMDAIKEYTRAQWDAWVNDVDCAHAIHAKYPIPKEPT